ncbi:hypothetical protein [Roseinatronobacter thiooxidans]|uniref:hypothetical protein n=1 Tax=Roseinatronobacter thiooxidans TaxID=121821 RepID=UPI001160A966|nr:hypothetical protein [Roseinatronobacter thiooxidans]
MPPVVPERSSVFSTYDEDRNREKLVDFLVNVQAKTFDKAASYNNIVVSLGFAGFFTLWAWSQPVIDAVDAPSSNGIAMCHGGFTIATRREREHPWTKISSLALIWQRTFSN